MHQAADLASQARRLFESQLSTWKLARDNYAALANVQNRTIDLGDFSMRLQFNPARIVSSGAKIDPKTIAQRKCFLCTANRPAEQTSLPFGDDYLVLLNPFPIFPEHFTIPRVDHVLQLIDGAFESMLRLAEAMAPRYTVFYNGPRAGASAPDHLHFQAGGRGFMTIESELDRLKGAPIADRAGAKMYAVRSLRPFVLIESRDLAASVEAFDRVCRALAEVVPATDEPSLNILAFVDAGVFKTIILPRDKHRPACYFAEGDARILLSPGSVDLGGVCIMPVERDYQRLTAEDLRQMLREVMIAPENFDRVVARL